jgi:tetraacyldisaccharide 4'-kinase
MRRLWNQKEPGLLIRPVLGFLTLVSFIYGSVCWVRLFLYRVGLLRTWRLNTLVISIGNLTVGGTGKTPLVIALVEYLSRKGLKVGVLSRGYKGKRAKDMQWVSDGQQLLASPEEAGEEPYLIATRLKNAPIVVGRDRYQSGKRLLERFKLDAILLDDGFQHLRLHRDINLLVIDGTLPFGLPHSEGQLLPRGMLRESLHGIRRASAILVSRMEQCNPPQAEWSQILRRVRYYHPQVPVFGVFFKPTGLIELASGKMREVTSLKGTSILVFSGIGHPASFRFFLEQLEAKVMAEVVFEDHHRYTAEEIKKLIRTAQANGIMALITTEKDGVKIREFLDPDDPVWALRVDLERFEDPQAWEHFIHERIKVG